MTVKVKLSSRLLTDVFWDIMFHKDEERSSEQQALYDRLSRLDELRQDADYNTGSISYAAAWSLYTVVRHFKPKRVIEVGTFIGKSTTSIASAMDDGDSAGVIYTCDGSNDLKLPWDGRTRIQQFPKTLSGDMFKAIEEPCDMVFLDGRLKKADLDLLDRLITADTVFVLDDFEGIEKGVANLMFLAALDKLKAHFLVLPASTGWLAGRGFTSHSVTAVFMPSSSLVFSRQG